MTGYRSDTKVHAEYLVVGSRSCGRYGRYSVSLFFLDRR